MISGFLGWVGAPAKNWPKCSCGMMLLPVVSNRFNFGLEWQCTNIPDCPQYKTWDGRQWRIADVKPLWLAGVQRNGKVTMGFALFDVEPGKVKDMSQGLVCVAKAAERLLEHDRGGDVWAFTRDGTVYTAHFHDDARVLYAYQVGQRRPTRTGAKRPPHTCTACKGDLVPGATAYKASLPHQGLSKVPVNVTEFVRWRDVQLCESCVRSGLEAQKVGRFRVIQGGAGR